MRSLRTMMASAMMLMLSGAAQAGTQDHQPEHGFPIPGVRTLTTQPFTTLPKGVLFMRFENFSTLEAAQRAATPASAAVEWAGKIWLITLGPKEERARGGSVAAEVGPIPPIPPAKSYVLDVNVAEFGPEVKAELARQVHTHPGPEIFYLLSGEQCLETPNGATRARMGEGTVAPANTPMQLNIVGTEKRRAFFIIIHDAEKPRATPSDWQPTGACSH